MLFPPYIAVGYLIFPSNSAKSPCAIYPGGNLCWYSSEVPLSSVSLCALFIRVARSAPANRKYTHPPVCPPALFMLLQPAKTLCNVARAHIKSLLQPITFHRGARRWVRVSSSHTARMKDLYYLDGVRTNNRGKNSWWNFFSTCFIKNYICLDPLEKRWISSRCIYSLQKGFQMKRTEHQAFGTLMDRSSRYRVSAGGRGGGKKYLRVCSHFECSFPYTRLMRGELINRWARAVHYYQYSRQQRHQRVILSRYVNLFARNFCPPLPQPDENWAATRIYMFFDKQKIPHSLALWIKCRRGIASCKTFMGRGWGGGGVNLISSV